MKALVTGATGTVGRHVVDLLLAGGAEVRALTRRPGTAHLPAEAEVVAGDLERVGEVEGLFEGVDRLYLVAVGETARQAVDLAVRSGVRRIVVLSSASVGIEGDPGGRFHRAVEVAVEESGLEWTHVRPGMFAANLLDWADAIREGVVKAPYDNAKQAPVHEVDVAGVAAAALLEDGHDKAVHTLSGPAALTKSEQLAAITGAVGVDARFEELTPEQWREHVAGRLPDHLVGLLLGYWEHAAANPDRVLPGVERVLRRPARSLAEWAADHVADFR